VFGVELNTLYILAKNPIFTVEFLNFPLLFQICPEIKKLKRHTVEFIEGKTENFDAIILATGYKSNVPSWLKVTFFFLYL
jgi:hypothetical protein